MFPFFFVSFFSSIVGAVCGIGGGVIIKPVLDLLGLADVAAISFLSGCTVLSMSCYTVGRSMIAGEKTVDVQIGTPLAVGAAIGGVFGKGLFSVLKSGVSNLNTVGSVQAICLAVITAGTLVYTINKEKVKTRQITSVYGRVLIGLILGMMSSFLGIGGGPINLVVLFYFFSMDTKTAAANSLYIILFGQAASLLVTVLTKTVPYFRWDALLLMVAGGIGGGITGRWTTRKLNNRAVENLFMLVMVMIISVCLYNAFRFSFK